MKPLTLTNVFDIFMANELVYQTIDVHFIANLLHPFPKYMQLSVCRHKNLARTNSKNRYLRKSERFQSIK